MFAKSDPHPGVAGFEYTYRRPLSARELLPAIGIGIGIAAAPAAFRVTRVMLQRTPLRPELHRPCSGAVSRIARGL